MYMYTCTLLIHVHVFIISLGFNLPEIQIPARKADDSPPLVDGSQLLSTGRKSDKLV